MRTIRLGGSGMDVPTVAVGCMRIGSLEPKEARAFVGAALELGMNFFDHADIYGGGRSEEAFAEAAGIGPSVREGLFLQSKCGIVPGRMYDFSEEHIIGSVDGTLRRLRTEYLDVLLLHRPDALMDPEEVARAFERLAKGGKVRHFGVSNHNPMQMALLERYLTVPIVANQLQFSVTNATMVSVGINVNTMSDSAVSRDGGVLDYCRLKGVTVQPWSPFQHGSFEGAFLGNPKFASLNGVITEVAGRYGVSETTAVMAWMLRHPARMQPITGTMKASRLAECAKAADVAMSREDWYAIYKAAGNALP
ncbi:MAG: aldo/keto reductase [Oscillospiraceae bacterium]|nr:aldo/keto reductase [Oscillospiraceae bacterium]